MRLRICSFREVGHGAAATMTFRRDDKSYLESFSFGNATKGKTLFSIHSVVIKHLLWAERLSF